MPTIPNLPAAIASSAADLFPGSQSDGQTHAVTPSQMAVLATGATTARSLAARLADIVSVEDFGVVDDPNGSNFAANTAAYQNAINAASGSARLRHRAALTVYVSGLVSPGNFILEVDGLLKLANNINGPLLLLNGANHSIKGCGVLDGNKANQTSSGAGCAGINTGSNGASNISIEDITIQNCFNWPVNITASNGIYLGSIKALNCGNSFEVAGGSYDFIIENCFVSRINDDAIAAYGGVYNGVIRGNFVTLGSVSGINVQSDSAQPAPCHDIDIVDNLITNCGLGGISVVTPGLTGVYQDRITIRGNRMYGNMTAADGQSGQADIGLGGLLSGTVCDNLISASNGTNNYGIVVPALPSNGSLVISNNLIYNIGSGGTSNVGIDFQNPFNVTAVGNCIFDNRSTKCMAFAMNGSVSYGCVFSSNNLTNTIGATFNVTLNSDTVFSGQIYGQDGVYNISQQVQAPSFLATSPPPNATAFSGFVSPYTATQAGTVFLQGGSGVTVYITRGAVELNLGTPVTIPVQKGDVVTISATTMPGFSFFPA
jgi:hypothetical protein